MLRFRNYWSILPLGVAAIALLVAAGAPSTDATAGAGFALLGAAITRAIDLARERTMESARETDRRRTDLDETRRVAYAALAVSVAPGTPVLVASIVNSLSHHGLGVDPDEAMSHVATVINGAGGESSGGQWLREQIDRITEELDKKT